MFSKILAAAAAVTIATTSGAFAWGDMYMGDGTANPNSPGLMAYDGPNYCPAGLQPVVLNGVVCCGTATGMSYKQMMAHPMPRKRVAHRHTYTHTHRKTHSHSYTHAHGGKAHSH